ncbi:hypothetical protein GCM10009092_38420 [Bowmanella denitrificans]|uniref:Flagellar hook-length control protein-like C-terminal domain-containing protein n=1 Tax=Bowmanella denitrificans TaxID=366582 RepID=A0ABN0XQT8_9ALTE
MSDLLPTSQQSLLSALRQLQQSAALPEAMLQQLSQAEVKILPGNQLLLNLGNRQVQINASDLKGKLLDGGLYQLLTSGKDNTTLLFYPQVNQSQAQPTQIQTLILNNQLLQALLPLVGKGEGQLPEVFKVSAQVISQQPQQLTLDIQGKPVKLQMPMDAPKLAPGQLVELHYQRQTGQWQLTLYEAPNSGKPINPSPAAAAPLQPSVQSMASRGPVAGSEWVLPAQKPELLSRVDLFGQGLRIDIHQLKQWAEQLPVPVARPLVQWLAKLTTTAQFVQLQQPSGERPQLQSLSTPPSASLILDKPALQQLQSVLKQQISVPTEGQASPAISKDSMPIAGKPIAGQAPSHPTKSQSEVTVTTDKPLVPDKAVLTPTATQQAAAQVDKQGLLYQQLQELSRKLYSQQESPARLLTHIESALADSRSVAPDTVKLLQQLSTQLKQSLPQGNEQDTAALRALLSTPALSLTPAQLLTPNSSQGFVGALVTLLQVTLASRLASQHSKLSSEQAQKLSEGLASLLEGGRPTASAPVSQRNLSDLSMLEQRHQLLRELGRMLGNHSGAKSLNAESQIQGQDSFYYNLPLGQGEPRRELELLIRREPPPNKKNKKAVSADRQWNLTMKLEIGELGGLLAKARLYQTELELDFYAANANLRDLVIQFIPHLRKRLTGLGLQVNHSQCQLGKIPAHLQQRPYHIFETQA